MRPSFHRWNLLLPRCLRSRSLHPPMLPRAPLCRQIPPRPRRTRLPRRPDGKVEPDRSSVSNAVLSSPSIANSRSKRDASSSTSPPPQAPPPPPPPSSHADEPPSLLQVLTDRARHGTGRFFPCSGDVSPRKSNSFLRHGPAKRGATSDHSGARRFVTPIANWSIVAWMWSLQR